jgi:hypothetical protein
MFRVTYITVATCFLIGCEQGPEPAKPGSKVAPVVKTILGFQ